MRHVSKMSLTAAALGAVLLGATYLASAEETQPAYDASIKISNQNETESGEAAKLVSMAKIDATTAAQAALARVPGSVLKVALDNENGNLVYSVEIKTASNEIKDVKVDAGNAAILNVDAGSEDNGIENESGGDSDQEDK